MIIFENRKQEPITSRNHKTFHMFCFLCCFTSDPLETVAHIPTCGYIPRQTIDLHLHVNNKSNQPVLEFTIQLIQVSSKEEDEKRSVHIHDRLSFTS